MGKSNVAISCPYFHGLPMSNQYTMTLTVMTKMSALYNKFLDILIFFISSSVIFNDFPAKSTKKILSVKKKGYFCTLNNSKLRINA